jgi:hypothetical protein
MKRLGLVLGVIMLLAVLSGVALADCESDCDGPFQTCLNICRQTTKEDSSEAASCVNNCLTGVSGCVRRCKEKEAKSATYENFAVGSVPAGVELVAFNRVEGASCIDQGLTCILNGTPCCAPYECTGKFPNTTCQ